MDPLEAGAVERVLIDAWLPAPDAAIIDRPDWAQLSSPSIPDFTGNGVYLARLDPDEADARIAAVMRDYAALGVASFRWVVGPSSAPADLSARLVRAGLRNFGPTLGMARTVPRELPATPEGLRLEPVTLANVETFVTVSAAAWQRDEPGYREAVGTSMIRKLSRSDDAHRSWLVWRGDDPVGVTSLRLIRATTRGTPNIGYFQGGAVVPSQRRAGIHRVMIDHRLAILRELGFEHAVIWALAGPSSHSGLRAGFVERCRAEFLEGRP